MVVAEDQPLDLEAELLADSKNSSGCSVCKWLEERPDAAQWDAAFKNPQITQAALMRGMQKRGAQFKAQPVASHLREKHRGA